MNIIQLNRVHLNSISLNALGTCEGRAGVKVLWEDGTAEGFDVIVVKDAKANSISSLNITGGCAQSGTPSPSASKDIVTSSGALRYTIGKNLLEVCDDNIVAGKYINNNGEVTSSAANVYFQRFVAVKPSTAYTLSTSRKLNYANFMEYDANGAFIKRTLYGSSGTPAGTETTHTMGDTTAFVIIGSNVDATAFPAITKKDVLGISWMFNEGATALKYEAYSGKVTTDGNDAVMVYGKNLSVGELVGKGYASTGAVSTSTTFCGNLHKIPVSAGQVFTASWGNLPDGVSGVFVNTWKEDGSWNTRQAISAADHLTYTIPNGVGEVNFTLYKTGGITIGAETWLQVEYGDTATEYAPAVEPSTAPASTLLGVGEFADVQNIISGEIGRAVGYKVLDGSEVVSISNKAYTIGINEKVRSKEAMLCTHFAYSTSTSSALANNTFIGFASQNVGFRNDNCPDVESFKQFLQREYAKGTPVIVVYPLANATTENEAPQFVGNPKGDVTILRDAEFSGLPMNVTLKVKGEEQEGGGGGLITFSVGSYGDLTAVEGMTWFEFCNSEYNIHEFFANTNNGEVLLRSEPDMMGWNYTDIIAYDNEKGRLVWSDDVIISGKHYDETVW